jgi:CHASE2 domain-containing sensor protein
VGSRFAWCDTQNVQALALWALARLLPAYRGEDGDNPARSLRRRFALVGLLLGSGLVAFLWDWTASIAVVGGASVVIVAGLWLYSEHRDRSEA